MNSIKKEIKKLYLKIFYFIYSNYIYLFRSIFFFRKSKNIKNKKISILCPSRQRVKKTERFLNSLYQKSKDIKNLEILILLDKDEKFDLDYRNLVAKFNKISNIIFIHNKDFLTNSERMNYLASVSTGEILVVANDDMIFLTTDWDHLLNYEFSKTKKNEPFSVWLKCDRKYLYLDASAFPAINKCWYDKLGYLSYSKFRMWYLDTWICDLGRKTGLFIVSKNIKVKQFHANSYKDEADNTHFKNHTKENLKYDDQIWLDTKIIRKIDAIKLKS